LRASDTVHEWDNSVSYICKTIDKLKETSRKIVVVTHHAPSYLSRTMQDNFTKFYCSDLSNAMLDHSPDLWIHGHLHGMVDYTIGNTRVMANARGYLGSEVVDFDPNLNVIL